MPRIKMTDAWLRTLQVPDRTQQDFFDTVVPELVVRASYGGTLTFRVRYRAPKRAPRRAAPPLLSFRGDRATYSQKLGTYPSMTLTEARVAARKFSVAPELAASGGAALIVADISAEFLAKHVGANRLRSEREIRRLFDKYVLPYWGNRRLSDIKRRDVSLLMDRLVANHGTAQADRVLATISKMMGWHQARDDSYTSPIVRGMARGGPSERDRVLADGEIAVIWSHCDGLGTFGDIVKLLLLTAQRRTKVAGMRWEDLTANEWRVPRDDREKDTGGRLILPPLALQLINSRPRISGHPYVFPGRDKAGAEPVSYNSFSDGKSALDSAIAASGISILPWVLHDLRRTARTLMSQLGVQSAIAELILGHRVQGVQRVYDRHKYEEPKREALERLSTFIRRLVEKPSNDK